MLDYNTLLHHFTYKQNVSHCTNIDNDWCSCRALDIHVHTRLMQLAACTSNITIFIYALTRDIHKRYASLLHFVLFPVCLLLELNITYRFSYSSL
jgi:hypothetical protein